MQEGIQLSELLYTLGKTAGVIGFVCLSLLIFSGDTARYFDQYFGLDRIIKFQRKFSLFTALFVLFHPIFFMISSGEISYYLIPDFTILPFALGVIGGYIFVIIMIASQMYKRISYSVWQYLHILTYILFFFGLYHAVNWGSDSSKTGMKVLYTALFIAVIIGIIYRTQYKIRKMFAGRFFVKEVKQETKDTFTLVLKPEKTFRFKSGQFCFLRLEKDKLYARHPFSISSAPQKSDLHFTIKNTGRFTSTAYKLQEKEEVKVDGPFGKFLVKDTKKELVFIAGGVGITPFMSIIQNHFNNQSKQNILLLYGSRKHENIIFKKQLDNIKTPWFKKVYILSQEESVSDQHETGYINKEIIKKYVKNMTSSLFYICGPKKMTNSVKEILLKLGIMKKDIVIEDFFW